MTGSRRKHQADGPNPRTVARMAAVQGLYQMDLAGADIEAVIAEFVTFRFLVTTEGEDGEGETLLEGADPVFFAELLRGVLRRQRDIDPIVHETLATGWTLVRVDSILRAILRAGVFELMERTDVPVRVVINEYINVAHAFFTEDEPKVVNGVLDRLAHRLRPAEFQSKEPKPVDA